MWPITEQVIRKSVETPGGSRPFPRRVIDPPLSRAPTQVVTDRCPPLLPLSPLQATNNTMGTILEPSVARQSLRHPGEDCCPHPVHDHCQEAMGMWKFPVNTAALLKHCEFSKIYCNGDCELAVMLAIRVSLPPSS